MTDTPITPAQLAEWRDITDAATPGPWRVYYGGDGLPRVSTPKGPVVSSPTRVADATFIAAARTDIPRLLGEVERLRAELDDERERVQGLANTAMAARWELERDGDEMDAMRVVVNAAVQWHRHETTHGGTLERELERAVDAYLAGREGER